MHRGLGYLKENLIAAVVVDEVLDVVMQSPEYEHFEEADLTTRFMFVLLIIL